MPNNKERVQILLREASHCSVCPVSTFVKGSLTCRPRRYAYMCCCSCAYSNPLSLCLQQVRTGDLGGYAMCDEFTRAVIANLSVQLFIFTFFLLPSNRRSSHTPCISHSKRQRQECFTYFGFLLLFFESAAFSAASLVPYQCVMFSLNAGNFCLIVFSQEITQLSKHICIFHIKLLTIASSFDMKSA